MEALFIKRTVRVVATMIAVMVRTAEIFDCPPPRFRLKMGFVTKQCLSKRRLGSGSFFMGRMLSCQFWIFFTWID